MRRAQGDSGSGTPQSRGRRSVVCQMGRVTLMSRLRGNMNRCKRIAKRPVPFSARYVPVEPATSGRFSGCIVPARRDFQLGAANFPARARIFRILRLGPALAQQQYRSGGATPRLCPPRRRLRPGLYRGGDPSRMACPRSRARPPGRHAFPHVLFVGGGEDGRHPKPSRLMLSRGALTTTIPTRSTQVRINSTVSSFELKTATTGGPLLIALLLSVCRRAAPPIAAGSRRWPATRQDRPASGRAPGSRHAATASDLPRARTA